VEPLAVPCPHCKSGFSQSCRKPDGDRRHPHASRIKRAETINAEVDAWNAAHPVGTMVRAYPGLRPEDRRASDKRPPTVVIGPTRTRAWVPRGQERPVVMVQSYGSWIALSHVDVIGD
jgi:hypothetical protein